MPPFFNVFLPFLCYHCDFFQLSNDETVKFANLHFNRDDPGTSLCYQKQFWKLD